MKKIIRRGAAATLAAVTLVTSAAVPVRAAAPRVQVDEAATICYNVHEPVQNEARPPSPVTLSKNVR